MFQKLLKMNGYYICTALGGILIIIGAIYQYNEKVQENDKALKAEKARAEEAEAILRKATEIISRQQIVIDQTREISALQADLLEKNDKIVSLQDKAIEQITGGKGVPKLQFLVVGSHLSLKLANDTSVPLKSVSVSLKRRVLDYGIAWEKLHAGTFPPPRNAEPDEYLSFDDLYKGDIGVGFVKSITDRLFGKIYSQVDYDYIVRWQYGFYEGCFRVVNNPNGLPDINHDYIWNYTRGFDYSKAVWINNDFSKFNPEPVTSSGR